MLSKKSYLSLLSIVEREEFKSVYTDIVNSLVALNDRLFLNMRMETDWMVTVMDYNVSPKYDDEIKAAKRDGIGCLVPAAYKTLVQSPEKEKMRLAYILGWAAEIFLGAQRVTNEIMDGKTDCGENNMPCWHTQKDVGLNAINDSLMLKMVHRNVIQIYFGDHEELNYKLQDLARNLHEKMICGRMLLEQMRKSLDIYASYTMENYVAVVKYERSYYSFYLPIKVAIILAGHDENVEDYRLIRIMLKFGYLQQLEDDFINAFECKNIVKFSWFFVRALEKLRGFREYELEDPTLEKAKYVFENSFETCDTEIVLEMYLELKLDEEYLEECKRTKKIIIDEIDKLNSYNKANFGISRFLLGLLSNI